MATFAAVLPATIPSPTQGVWHLGPLPLRAYALCILLGIVVAVWWGKRRYQARGGNGDVILDIAVWAVPFGIVGGRIYHVLSSGYGKYFGGDNPDPMGAFRIWDGGLGIWGAIAFGGVGAWIGARRAGVLLPPVADAIAPGILTAQAIGRLGNWFNNELYGSPTDRPWGLRVYEWDGLAGKAAADTEGNPIALPGYYHPTFLYESLWNLAGVAFLVWADRRWKLGHGRVFALYVAVYCAGRTWIEMLRIDEANRVAGVRLNVWTSVLVGLGAVVYFVISSKLRPGRETVLTRTSRNSSAAVDLAVDDAAENTSIRTESPAEARITDGGPADDNDVQQKSP